MLTHCGNNVRNRYSGCVFSVKDIVPVPLKTSRNLFIGIGKSTAAGSLCPSNARQRSSVMAQCITRIIQANGMRELRIEHAHHMTPGSETACFLVHPMFASQLDYQVTRNIIAKLMQYAQLIRGWFCPSCFFHGWFPNRNHSLTTRPTFSFSLPWDRIAVNSPILSQTHQIPSL